MHMSQRLMISTGRSVALAAVAAMTLTVTAPLSANAGTSMRPAHAKATDFSAARRHRYVNRGGGAAAAAAFAGIVGTIGAVAAAQAQRDGYDGPYAYGGGPYYAEPYYSRPYYGSPYGGYGYPGSGSYLDPGGNIIPR